MDGCVSKPIDSEALVSTVAAAVPAPPEPPALVLDTLYNDDDMGKTPGALGTTKHNQFRVVTEKTRPRRRRKGGTGATPGAAGTAASLQLKGNKDKPSTEYVRPGIVVPVADIDDSISGVYQMDADTSLPYTVMGRARADAPLFHFIVIQVRVWLCVCVAACERE